MCARRGLVPDGVTPASGSRRRHTNVWFQTSSRQRLVPDGVTPTSGSRPRHANVWFQTSSHQRLVPDGVTPTSGSRPRHANSSTHFSRDTQYMPSCREIDLSQIISAGMTRKRQSCRSDDICLGILCLSSNKNSC